MKSAHTRGFWGTFGVTAAASVIPFGVLWAMLYSFTRDLPFADLLRAGIIAGLLFGLVFGFVMAFIMQGASVDITFSDKDRMKAQLDVALPLMGYRLRSRDNGMMIYSPTWRAGILAGRVTVQLENNTATISGPQTYVRRLQRRLEGA